MAELVPMDKDAFKKGCQSNGGSYVENLDGSFQCNLKDGGVIKCANTTTRCTYTMALPPNPETVIKLTKPGALELKLTSRSSGSGSPTKPASPSKSATKRKS